MRSEIAETIKSLLMATGKFAAVVGIGADKPAYPLARVWINGSPKDSNINDSPDALIDLRVAVQIETWLPKDEQGDSVETVLYEMVDAAYLALHNAKLPGKGIARPLICLDHPGMTAYAHDSPAVYTMQVSVWVAPRHFSIR